MTGTTAKTFPRFFVLRTPLLPWNSWSSIGDRGKELRRVCSQPAVREALLLSSRNIYDRLETEGDPLGRRDGSLRSPVLRYIGRMSARPTPFGLCAGVTMGTFGGKTNLRLRGMRFHRTRTELDHRFMDELIRSWKKDSRFRRAQKIVANPSALILPQTVLFVSRPDEPGPDEYGRAFDQSQIPLTGGVRDTLSFVADGCTYVALESHLAAKAWRSAERTHGSRMERAKFREAARGFIDELLRLQLLFLEADAPGFLLRDGGDAAREPSRKFQSINSTLRRLDRLSPGQRFSCYQALEKKCSALVPSWDRRQSPTRTVLYKQTRKCRLPDTVFGACRSAIHILHRAGMGGGEVGRAEIAEFRDRFLRRFGSAQVPLLEALSPETGVGFELRSTSSPAPVPSETAFIAHLSELVLNASGEGRRELVLDDVDLKILSTHAKELPALPTGVCVHFSVLSEDRIYFRQATGPGATRMLERFAPGEPRLERALRDFHKAEASLRPDAILAAVDCPGGGKAGNWQRRSDVFEFEIPCFGYPSAPPERRIAPKDLCVSVELGRVLLHSRSRGKEVIPVLADADNFLTSANPLYRFLGQVGLQEVVPALSWRWNELSSLPALPRVRWKNVVFSPARWSIVRTGEEESADRRIEMALRRYQPGRHLLLHDVRGDGYLPVNTDSKSGRQLLIESYRKDGRILLSEILSGPEDPVVTGPEGGFANEVIFPLLLAPPPPSAPKPKRRAPVKRSYPVHPIFPPGSRWHYYKVYCGETQANEVLRRFLPALETLFEKGFIRRWHFLRYLDPEFHLRFRFEVPKGRARNPSALSPFTDLPAQLMESRLISDVQIITYRPEYSRYAGVRAMNRVEDLFFLDSRFFGEMLKRPLNSHVASALEPMRTSTFHEGHWLCRLFLVHSWLEDFQLSRAERIAWLKEWIGKVAWASNEETAPRRKILARWMREKGAWICKTVLDPEHPMRHRRAPRSGQGAQRSCRALLQMRDRGELSGSELSSIIRDIVHMSMNRFFFRNAIDVEGDVLKLLLRIYDTRNFHEGLPL